MIPIPIGIIINPVLLLEDEYQNKIRSKKKKQVMLSTRNGVLTDSPRPRKYWNALKTKLKEEGSQLSQKVGQLKLESSDGKKYLTDVANTETLFETYRITFRRDNAHSEVRR